MVVKKLIQRQCYEAAGSDLAQQLTVAQHHTSHSMLLHRLSTTPAASPGTTLHIHTPVPVSHLTPSHSAATYVTQLLHSLTLSTTPHHLLHSDILVLKLISVLVFILFSSQNFYFI